MTNLRNLMCAGGYENETGIEMGEVGMSDLRELRDTVERVFKQVCRLSAENKNLARLQGDLGDIFGRLALAVAKQEALSPAPQDDRAKHRVADMAESIWYDSKGSSVEYYKDRLVEVAVEFHSGTQNFVQVERAIYQYRNALSASPDPEGEWQWVPNTHVVMPREGTVEMLGPLVHLDNPSRAYRNVVHARPPVPKKEERV